MCVYQLGNLRVIDLTKYLDPATETRRCHLYRFNTGGPIPDYHTIMDLTSHLGTHCECPYHHDDNWPDAAALPLTNFLGRGIYATVEGVAPNGYITREVLDRVLGKKVRRGDVVILDSPYKLPPFTEKTNTAEDRRLFVNGETAQWMVDHEVKCVGVWGRGLDREPERGCEAVPRRVHGEEHHVPGGAQEPGAAAAGDLLHLLCAPLHQGA